MIKHTDVQVSPLDQLTEQERELFLQEWTLWTEGKLHTEEHAQ